MKMHRQASATFSAMIQNLEYLSRNAIANVDNKETNRKVKKSFQRIR